MDEFRFVGSTPTTLEGGRPIEPGEFTGPICVEETDKDTGELVAPANKVLFDDGLLLKLPTKAEQKKAAEEEEGDKS
jgi:hypothetical protein